MHYASVLTYGNYIGGEQESTQYATDVTILARHRTGEYWHLVGGKDQYKNVPLPANVECGYEETYDNHTDPKKMTSHEKCKHRPSSSELYFVCIKSLELLKNQEDTYVTEESRLVDYTRCIKCQKCVGSLFGLHDNNCFQTAKTASAKQGYIAPHKERKRRTQSV